MSNDFGILCNKPSGNIDYVKKETGRIILSDFDHDRQCILLLRAGLLEKRKKNMNICFQHEQLFGNYHKLKYKCRVKPKMSVNLQMAKNLGSKGYNALPSQIFC